MASQDNQGSKSNRGQSSEKETRDRMANEGGKSQSSSGSNTDRGMASTSRETKDKGSREGNKSTGGKR